MDDERTPPVPYEPPALAEVGEFNDVTLGFGWIATDHVWGSEY